MDNSSYIQIDDWYIGVHTNKFGDLFVYIDSNLGSVIELSNDISEDDRQWGRIFMHSNNTPSVRTSTHLRRKMRVFGKKDK